MYMFNNQNSQGALAPHQGAAMQPFHTIRHGLCLALLCALATGCASRTAPVDLYDFGPQPAAAASNTPAAPAVLALATVQAPTALNSPQMRYRLAYVDELQTRAYAGSRWSMAPAQLLEQRIKTRLTQAGTAVLSNGEGSATLPTLRIEVVELIQHFSSPQQSEAQLALRATLFSGRTLVAQQSFRRQAPAGRADAAAGARAMAEASDAVIDDMLAWLHAVPLQK